MSTLETIEVVNWKTGKGFLVINKDDFDPKKHKLFIDSVEPEVLVDKAVEENETDETEDSPEGFGFVEQTVEQTPDEDTESEQFEKKVLKRARSSKKK